MCDFKALVDYVLNHSSMNQPRFSFKLWDVGHGLSIWINTPSGQNHWIDLGRTDGFSPSQHVSRIYNVNKIDYLIISHPDSDHLSDLPYFLDSFGDPRAIRRNKSLPDEEKYGNLKFEWQKRFKKLDTTYTQSVAWNENPANPQNNGGVEYLVRSNSYNNELAGNDTSLVTMLLYKGLLIVCPGDIEPTGWDILWKNNRNELEKFKNCSRTRVLIAPHHGRKSGYSIHMMDVIEPHLVIVSDVWGESETHRSYFNKPLGIFQNGQLLQHFSTKRHGRVEIAETNAGDFGFYQYE